MTEYGGMNHAHINLCISWRVELKKILIIISQFILCMFLVACGSDCTDYYEERIEDYMAIAYYVLENHSAEDGSLVIVYLNDITDKELENSVQIAEEKFSYL